ncbi:MAG TPA: 50S ribosomal protein L11 methyltransferase [Gammaproteobacteria bacterium]|nr:50S ribosomal protein L11 methyltransferase [Gammaproteobacteria bacterium]
MYRAKKNKRTIFFFDIVLGKNKKMPWIEVHITTTPAHIDSISTQLSFLGAEAITLQDAGNEPIYEPSADAMWKETIMIGLFDYQHSIIPIVSYLEKQQSENHIAHFRLQEIGDEDWVRRSLDQFKPLKFGNRLWICPSWHTPPDLNAVNVILDPGLAFGTGTHPTTALCLEWLDNNIKSQECIMDYGCGSGILSLAALKLGAKRILAIDTDAQALEATERNAEKNAIYLPDLKTYFPAELIDEKADILIANILAKPLIELAPQFAKLVHSHGKIVLSGILDTQTQAILAVYSRYFTMQKPIEKEGWILLVGVPIA